MFQVKCTSKYKISDERGWKISFDVPDGDGYEGNGSFVLIVPDGVADGYVEGENYSMSIGA